MTSDKQLQRTWQRIAEEATQENDPRRLMKLIEELVSAVKELHQPNDQAKKNELPADQDSSRKNTNY
jgi:hypothetical protein